MSTNPETPEEAPQESAWEKNAYGLPSWKGRCLATTEQVAELAQLEPGTFERWRHDRKGPPRGVVWFKVGGAVRYDVDRFFAWLDEQRELSHAG